MILCWDYEYMLFGNEHLIKFTPLINLVNLNLLYFYIYKYIWICTIFVEYQSKKEKMRGIRYLMRHKN